MENFGEAMRQRGISLKNLINAALSYAGKDKAKLKAMYEYLTRVIEIRLEQEVQMDEEELKVASGSNQKKIELKLDESVRDFIAFAESSGRSASGLICELIVKKFGVNYDIMIRKPKSKKYGNTISFKIPKKLYQYILMQNSSDKPFCKIIRKIIEDFLRSAKSKDNIRNEIRI